MAMMAKLFEITSSGAAREARSMVVSVADDGLFAGGLARLAARLRARFEPPAFLRLFAITGLPSGWPLLSDPSSYASPSPHDTGRISFRMLRAGTAGRPISG